MFGITTKVDPWQGHSHKVVLWRHILCCLSFPSQRQKYLSLIKHRINLWGVGEYLLSNFINLTSGGKDIYENEGRNLWRLIMTDYNSNIYWYRQLTRHNVYFILHCYWKNNPAKSIDTDGFLFIYWMTLI